jgi:hypothetical protein
MATNEIKIIIAGDPQGLVTASKQSATALNAMAAAAESASKDFNQLGPSAVRAGQAVERLKNGLRDPAGGSSTENLANGFRSILRPIDELEDELLQLQQAIKRTTDPKQLKAFGDQVEKLNLQIGNIKVVTFQNSINKVNQSAAQAAANLRKISPGANEATFALTNLSRIAQDAPFGFIGIANNINPMLESFQRLKAQTGSTKTAFQALIGSLSGAGGLGLAVGIGSAALSLLGQGFFSAGRSAKKAKDDVDEFKETLKDAVSEASRDAGRVTTLFNALSSGTLDFSERKKALEELKSINKDFFGSLKDEEGLIKNLQNAYDGYLDRLQDIGRAKAIESQLTKLFDKKLQLELSIDSKFLGATDASTQRVIGGLRKELEKLGGALSPEELKQDINFFDKANDSLKRRVQIQQQIEKLEQGITVIRDAGSRSVLKQIQNLDLQIAGLSQLQKDFGEFNIKTDQHNKKESDALKARLTALEKIKSVLEDIRPERSKDGILDMGKLKSDITELAKVETEIGELKIKIAERDARNAKLPADQIATIVEGIKRTTRENIDNIFQREALLLESPIKLKLSRVEMAPFTQQELDALANGTKVRESLSGLASKTKEIKIKSDRQVRIELLGLEFVLAGEQARAAAERLRDTILNGAVDALSSTATAFGELIAGAFSGEGVGNSLAKAAQTLLNGIGGVLQEIGKQVIVTSTLVKALKESLKTLFANPVAAIGVGLGLVALGGSLKSIKIPGFAGGVNNFAGGLAIVGERGPELVNLPKGSDVIPNHMLNGSGVSVVLAGSLEVGFDVLRVKLQQQDERRRRI